LIGKPEGKRPLGRLRDRRKDNINIYLEEIGSEGVNWIHLVQDRVQRRALLNTIMDLRIPRRL
jgi:hypothetical protein